MFVLVSCGCCNKLPQAWFLKTVETYSFPVVEVKSWISITELESKCPQGCAPSRGSREVSLPCLFQLLVSGGNPYLVAASLQLLHPSAHHLLLFMCLFQISLFLFCVHVITFRAHPCNPGLSQHSSLNHTCKDPILIQGDIQSSQGLGYVCPLGRGVNFSAYHSIQKKSFFSQHHIYWLKISGANCICWNKLGHAVVTITKPPEIWVASHMKDYLPLMCQYNVERRTLLHRILQGLGQLPGWDSTLHLVLGPLSHQLASGGREKNSYMCSCKMDTSSPCYRNLLAHIITVENCNGGKL